MTEAEELEQIEVELDALGREITSKCQRALEILRGRVAIRRGIRFRILNASPHFGGMGGVRLYLRGPILKKDGSPHARNEENTPVSLIDKIEPLSSS